MALDRVSLNNQTGDFNTHSLSAVMNTDSINRVIVQTWIARASTRKSTIVFCINIAHVERLTQTFRSHGIDARYVFAKTPATERRQLITDFKRGKFPVLLNCCTYFF
jgi:ATP-dependent helicase IRC3